ncbi:MAG TPA: hypothetical protein VND64_01880 [Pirellulales bacterium]|nr:hypothetical protein [Pirellulales bacterium]
MIAQLSDEQRQAVCAGTPVEVRDGSLQFSLRILNWFTLIAEILAIVWIHWVLAQPQAAKAVLKPMSIAIWFTAVVLVLATMLINKTYGRRNRSRVAVRDDLIR